MNKVVGAFNIVRLGWFNYRGYLESNEMAIRTTTKLK